MANDRSVRLRDPAEFGELNAAESGHLTIRDDSLKASFPHLICSCHTITGHLHDLSFLLQPDLQVGSAPNILVND